MSNVESEPHFEPYIKIKNESGSDDIHYHALYEGLPEKFKQYARDYLNETEEGKEKGLQELKAFIQKENLGSIDDVTLLSVLRCCKYDMESSYSKLKRFLTRRQALLNELIKMDNATINAVLDDLTLCALPYRDKDGRIILYSRSNFRFHLYNIHDVCVCNSTLFLMCIKNPMTSVVGMSFIAESQCPLMEYYEVIKASKECIPFILDAPLRFGRVDGTNTHFLTRFLFAAARPIIPEKLFNRIHLHERGFDEVKKEYHPSLLPDVLEGTWGPLSDTFYRQKLMRYIDELKIEAYSNLS